MRTETEMIAYALEVDPRLLPWIPELLADFHELGSNAASIVGVLKDLGLPASAQVVDLGCGKGAVTVAIAKAFGCQVEGIELFAPFIDSCRQRATAAGVQRLCRFHHADILTLAGRTEPADVAVYAALGDVLGPLEESIGVIRCFVRRGGLILICDGYVQQDGTSDFPGFEDCRSPEDTRRRLTSHGDALRREVVESNDLSATYAQEVAQIRKRARALAVRHPELEADLTRYVEHQRQAYAYMVANFVPAIWVLERGA